MNQPAKPQLEPICAELRSKRYYFLSSPPRDASELLDASNDCWCNLTSARIGVDGDVVLAGDCVAERSCYRSQMNSNGSGARRGPSIEA